MSKEKKTSTKSLAKERSVDSLASSHAEAVEDQETENSLNHLADFRDLQGQRFTGVRTVLIVLSAKAMVLDVEALRQKSLLAYPDAAVFFMTTSGKPIGVYSPQSVDLLVDFTGPGQRQGWFFAKKLRKMAKFAVGRNAGLFRKKIYDRVFDEKSKKQKIPKDYLEHERFVQKQVLALAGVPVIPAGGTTADRSKSIALELPPLAN